MNQKHSKSGDYYFKHIGNGDYTNNIKLLKQYQETHDQSIRDSIVHNNIRLVINIASHYYQFDPAFDIDDYIQEGIIMLLKCIDNYDFERFEKYNCKFSSFVSKCIMNKFNMIYRRKLKCDNTISLNTIIFENDENVTLDTLVSSEYDLENAFILKMDCMDLIEKLSPKEKDVIKYRLDGKTFDEIGNTLGYTKSYISRVYSHGIGKLRSLYIFNQKKSDPDSLLPLSLFKSHLGKTVIMTPLNLNQYEKSIYKTSTDGSLQLIETKVKNVSNVNDEFEKAIVRKSYIIKEEEI